MTFNSPALCTPRIGCRCFRANPHAERGGIFTPPPPVAELPSRCTLAAARAMDVLEPRHRAVAFLLA
jgi:hypothetical protein